MAHQGRVCATRSPGQAGSPGPWRPFWRPCLCCCFIWYGGVFLRRLRRLRALPLSLPAGGAISCIASLPKACRGKSRLCVEEVNSHYERVRHTLESQRQLLADAAHELRSPIAALNLQMEVLSRTLDNTAAESRAKFEDRYQQGSPRHKTDADPGESASFAGRPAHAKCGGPEPGRESHAPGCAGPSVCKMHSRSRQCVSRLHGFGNFEMLAIMVRNVLDNAIRYTPEGGTITATLSAAGGSDPECSDNGPGIPPEYMDRVFDRFFRVPGSVGQRQRLGSGDSERNSGASAMPPSRWTRSLTRWWFQFSNCAFPALIQMR